MKKQDSEHSSIPLRPEHSFKGLSSHSKERASLILEKYRQAGQIARDAKKLAISITKPGASILEICEQIEGFIRKRGAKPAFPVNVSTNTIAAHYTAYPLDDARIPNNSIVKIDLGAHIDGYIVDTAVSVWFSPKLDDLGKASRDALDSVIEYLKPGVKLSEIGQIAQKVIESYGFHPIKNLYGHQIKRYVLHGGLSIPSTVERSWIGRDRKIEAGRIYAIEPFATTGKQGMVGDGVDVNIFRFLSTPNGKSKLFQHAKNFYRIVGPLPFSPRWLTSPSSRNQINESMRIINALVKQRIVMGYPTLVDIDGGIVSQFEHTVRITRSGAEVLT